MPRGKGFRSKRSSSSNVFSMKTGVAAIDHLFMPAKLHWFRQHEADLVSKVSRIALLSDYFTEWLTATRCTEAATAALSGLVEIDQLEWWRAACEAVQIPSEWLPRIVRAGTDLGPILSTVADELGLPPQCRFIVGCLDQHAGAIGAGNVNPGHVSETTGTVLATVRCSATRLAAESSDMIFQGPAFAAGLFYQMVFSEQSAGILERFRNSLSERPSFAELDRLAGESPEGARGLELHPAAFRRDVKEIFMRRQPFHTRGDEVRAIYEGVAAELARQVRVLSGNDLPPVVFAAGGGARSRLWLDIKSKAIGRPVRAVDCLEPTGRGAAIIALAAIRQRDLPELACEISLKSDRGLPEVQHAGERPQWDQ